MRLPPNYGDAILTLRPDARYIMHEDDLENIEWVEVEGVPPTPTEIEAQLVLLQEGVYSGTFGVSLQIFSYSPGLHSCLDACPVSISTGGICLSIVALLGRTQNVRCISFDSLFRI